MSSTLNRLCPECNTRNVRSDTARNKGTERCGDPACRDAILDALKLERQLESSKPLWKLYKNPKLRYMSNIRKPQMRQTRNRIIS